MKLVPTESNLSKLPELFGDRVESLPQAKYPPHKAPESCLSPESNDVTESDQSWEGIQEFYRTKSGLLIRLVKRFCADEADAEDFVQEAFLSLYLQSSRGLAPQKAVPWLVAAARNIASKRHHQRQRESLEMDEPARYVDTAPSLEKQISEDDRRKRLERAIQRLDPVEQQCLRWRAEGVEFKEIGAMLGISICGAVRRTKTAIEKVRRRVKA